MSDNPPTSPIFTPTELSFILDSVMITSSILMGAKDQAVESIAATQLHYGGGAFTLSRSIMQKIDPSLEEINDYTIESGESYDPQH